MGDKAYRKFFYVVGLSSEEEKWGNCWLVKGFQCSVFILRWERIESVWMQIGSRIKMLEREAVLKLAVD